jgi:N,N'-diacetylchitobiose transport system permease protein
VSATQEDAVVVKPVKTASDVPPASAPNRRPGAAINRIWPYLMVAPAILGIAVLLLYPLIKSLVLSFQHFRMRELIQGNAEWVGFDNYSTILKDSEFWEVVRRTFVFTAINVVLIMVIGTLVALMLNKLGKKMRLTVLIGLILAWATPVIAATTVFQWLFQSQLGVVNWLLVKVGFTSFEGHSWMADGKSAMAIIIMLIVWQSVPFAALTIYAGLTTIPTELYESARLDGAGPVKIFRLVTFPMIRPIFALVTSLEVIWVFKSFAQIWAITQGGPDGETTTLPVYAYQVAMAMKKFDASSAISMLTVLILAFILVFYFRQMFKQERESDS